MRTVLFAALAACMSVCLPVPARNLEPDNNAAPVLKGREVFWDDYLTEECSACKMMHSPWYKSSAITCLLLLSLFSDRK